jgi:hypothetical protein
MCNVVMWWSFVCGSRRKKLEKKRRNARMYVLLLESNLVSTGNPQSPKRGLPQTTGISKGPTNDVRKRPKADQGHRTWAQVARSHRTHQKRNPHEAASSTVKRAHSV